MREEDRTDRTDLPYDQVANDNDGQRDDFNALDDQERTNEALPLDYNEETAAEVTPAIDANETQENTQEMEQAEEERTGLGWTGLVLSILSLFFMPLLTASAGVIVGYFAYRGGARTLGLWAIGIGLFSVIIALFFAPFF